MPNNFFIPTTPSALPRLDSWLPRPDPRPLIEVLYAGLLLTGGADLRWPSAGEFHNSSMPAQLSPFLGWDAYFFLQLLT